MTRYRFFMLYVIAALVFLRCVDMHVHFNQDHVPPGDSTPAPVHFVHGIDGHDSPVPDIDMDNFDASLVKKPVSDVKPVFLAVLLVLLVPILILFSAGFITAVLLHPPDVPLLRPQPRAPPSFAS